MTHAEGSGFRRRLTALLVGVLLLPSAVIGRGVGCGMPAGAPHGEHAPAAHHGSHLAAETVSGIPDADVPAPLPEAPVECVVTSCAGAGVVPPCTTLVDAAHVGDRVTASLTLAPDSPALGLEPPPPRA